MINKVVSRNELADILNVQQKRLTYLLYVKGIDNLYSSFDIPKKNGDFRHISAPNKELKRIQRSLSNVLWEYQKEIWKRDNKKPNVSHAFEKEKNIFTNARIHRNKIFVFNLDLENFFDSFHFGRIRGYFMKNENFKLPVEVATVIAQLVCFEGKLPQGAPSSPIITNLICKIFDLRIIKLAKKYRLDYTRYADDLTFSTNDKQFQQQVGEFYLKLKEEVQRAGFSINQKKTRLLYPDSRQEVTGVIVNKKISINREYYKKTRAMASALYSKGEFYIDGKKGTLNQLEGRFSFINQAEWFDNKMNGKKRGFYSLNGKEKQYKQFLFYKYFFANEKPIIVTEGKTDIVYIKAALKNLYKEYPELVIKNSKGQFEYKIAFLKKSKRVEYFLNIKRDGADTLNNIYSYFSTQGGEHYPNFLSKFKELGQTKPNNAVILLFDNELKHKDKPLFKFVKGKLKESDRKILEEKNEVCLIENLYLMITPLEDGKDIGEIEDLFDTKTLNTEIGGKHFIRKDKYDTTKFYGKDIFSKYVMKNYKSIDFSGYRTLLDNIKVISTEYKKENSNK